MTKEKDKNLKNTIKDFKDNVYFQNPEDLSEKTVQSMKNKASESKNIKESPKELNKEPRKEANSFRKRVKDKQEAKLEQTVEVIFAKEKIARRDTKILELLAEKENLTKKLQNQKQVEKDTKILELLAEKENLTKRLEKEKEEFIKYRSGSFLNQIIPSIDMMEKALSAKNVSPEVENWLKGFEMIFNNFITSIEQEGVKIITVKPGEYYNPDYHHAIDEQYSDDYKAGQIIKAYNQAYLLHDRLLRPASVIVAKSKNLNNEPTEDHNKNIKKKKNK